MRTALPMLSRATDHRRKRSLLNAIIYGNVCYILCAYIFTNANSFWYISSCPYNRFLQIADDYLLVFQLTTVVVLNDITNKSKTKKYTRLIHNSIHARACVYI
jgi:hypothetical protein